MNPIPDRARRGALRIAGAAGAAAIWPSATRAQSGCPEKAVTLVVPFSPGDIADVTARTVAESLTQTLGKPVVVENRPSAGSIVASKGVADARPDGHTLLMMTNSNALSVGLFKKLPYDPAKDLAMVSTLGFFDLGLFVAQESRFKTLADLLRRAKEKPGDVKLGTIAVGTTQHLAGQLFLSMAGVDMLTVPYRATPAIVVALRNGEIDVAAEIVGPMLPQVRAKALRALALTGDRPNPALPSVPTVQQSGVANFNVASWNAIAVPTGTPAPVVEKLHAAIQQAVGSAEVRRKLEPLGVRVQGGSAAQAQALLNSDIKRWGDVIRAAKIEPE